MSLIDQSIFIEVLIFKKQFNQLMMEFLNLVLVLLIVVEPINALITKGPSSNNKFTCDKDCSYGSPTFPDCLLGTHERNFETDFIFENKRIF